MTMGHARSLTNHISIVVVVVVVVVVVEWVYHIMPSAVLDARKGKQSIALLGPSYILVSFLAFNF